MQDLILAQNLTKVYGPSGFQLFNRKERITAVDDVSFSISSGQCFALVGESGCGKSTVGRLLLRLTEPTAGKVLFDGTDLKGLSPRKMKKFRPRMQMVYQDADNCLDPRYSVYRILEEPLKLQKLKHYERQKKILAIMNQVNLGVELMLRYPHELSGGQRQRVGIARALLHNPQFIVADEPAASLDLSVQAQMLQLLDATKKAQKTALLYISHNLRMVRFMSQKMAVMYLGNFMETGATASIFKTPLHPYTRMLFSALLCMDPKERRKGISDVIGEPPDSAFVPPGCAFHPRCSHRTRICEQQRPFLKMVSDGRMVACHFSCENGPGRGTPLFVV